MALRNFLKQISSWLRQITSGISDMAVQKWLTTLPPFNQSKSQSTMQGFILMGIRSLITVILICVTILPVVVYVSLLALLAGPFVWLIWNLNRFYLLFYGYFFSLTSTLTYLMITDTGPDILVGLLILATIMPLIFFVGASFLNNLPFGGIGLLIIFWPVYIIGKIVLSLIFDSINTPSGSELEQSIFLALVSIILIVVAKIYLEKRRFPNQNQPSLLRMLVDAPFMVPFFFGQTTWELVRDTIKLYKSTKDVLLRILLPVALFGSACVGLAYFTKWLAIYYQESQFGYLLILETVLVLAFMLIWTAFALMFENMRRPDLWVRSNRFTVDMFGVFLYAYPLSFYTLVRFTELFNYDFDPLFYATLAVIGVVVVLVIASTQMKPGQIYLQMMLQQQSVATRQYNLQKQRMEALFNQYPYLKLVYQWWPLIFPIAGLLAFITNPEIPSF
ncbi:MAG: hypothetical protein JW934_06920 [Anaerolineae bacterium]|nr:hypothetical protein [Anaerolineae bacterium]